MEILANALFAREHGIDDCLAGVLEFLVLELNQYDWDAALALGRDIGGGIAAHSIQFTFLARQLVGLDLHRQSGALGSNEGFLGCGALICFMGTHSG